MGTFIVIYLSLGIMLPLIGMGYETYKDKGRGADYATKVSRTKK